MALPYRAWFRALEHASAVPPRLGLSESRGRLPETLSDSEVLVGIPIRILTRGICSQTAPLRVTIYRVVY